MDEEQGERNKVFVIMSLEANHRGIYNASIKPAFEQELGWQCLRLDEQKGSGNIVRQIVENIADATLIVADLTALPVDVMYELGMAHSLSNRVLTLVKRGHQEMPFDLRTYRCIEYDDTAQGGIDLIQEIVEAVKALPEWSEKPSNPVQEYLPSERRYVPSNSIADHETAQRILTEQQKMQHDVRTMLDQLTTLQQSMQQSENVDTSLLDTQIKDLRQRLDEMTRKRNDAEYYMNRLAQERDTMLAQVEAVAAILEGHLTVITHPYDQAELVFVPAGLFVPGKPRLTEEERQQDTRFVRSFYMDRYPVTNAQFARFVDATRYQTIAERLNQQQGCHDPTWRTPAGPDSTWEQREHHPVIWVYRQDAWRYAIWAGRRLPTRLEWERAMRGLDGYTWPWGDEWQDHVCNLASTGTTPVDTFPAGASPVGCLDMVGNVWEWLADDLAGGKLLLMGGSWAEQRLGVGYKALVVPGDGTDGATGFRCAMDVPTE